MPSQILLDIQTCHSLGLLKCSRVLTNHKKQRVMSAFQQVDRLLQQHSALEWTAQIFEGLFIGDYLAT